MWDGGCRETISLHILALWSCKEEGLSISIFFCICTDPLLLKECKLCYNNQHSMKRSCVSCKWWFMQTSQAYHVKMICNKFRMTWKSPGHSPLIQLLHTMFMMNKFEVSSHEFPRQNKSIHIAINNVLQWTNMATIDVNRGLHFCYQMLTLSILMAVG